MLVGLKIGRAPRERDKSREDVSGTGLRCFLVPPGDDGSLRWIRTYRLSRDLGTVRRWPGSLLPALSQGEDDGTPKRATCTHRSFEGQEIVFASVVSDRLRPSLPGKMNRTTFFIIIILIISERQSHRFLSIRTTYLGSRPTLQPGSLLSGRHPKMKRCN